MIHVPTLMRGFSCFLLLAGVSACTYLIPDDVSVPRNNIVQGDRHKPLRQNVTPQNGANLQQIPNTQMAAAAPVMPVAVNPLSTPVPSNIQYPQFTDTSVPSASSRVATLDRVSTPITPAELTSPVPAAPVVAAGARRTPSENASILADRKTASPIQARRALPENGALQMAANDAALQGLIAVPPRPPLSGPDSTYSQMGVTRKDMEESRTDTLNAREQMNRDVAAEPSVFSKPVISSNAPEILSPLPAFAAPQAVPNKTLPTPVMAPALPVPAPATTRTVPAPSSSLITPVTPAISAPAPAHLIARAPLPAASGLPPIVLKSPAPLDVADAKPTLPSLPARTARGFNPMVALPPEQPVAQLPAISLTPPPSAEAPVDQSSTNTSILANSAFNPLNSSIKGVRQTQYLSPSRYADR